MLTPPRVMSLEQTMAYLNDDECLEVTPKNLRLRKNFVLMRGKGLLKQLKIKLLT